VSARPLISIIIGTARPSLGSLRCAPDEHYMLRTFQSLAAQPFTDFELIIADALAPTRNLTAEIIALSPTPWPFAWRVVPVTSWWLDQQMWALQATFNAGAVASRGHNLLFCGDCCQFPTATLTRSAELLSRGYDPHLVCIHRTNGFIPDYREAIPTPLGTYRTIEDLKDAGLYTPTALYGSTPHGDTRLSDPMMVVNGCILPQHASWQWFYGYGFISRTDFFSVNGWSELYDGEKSLGDVEMGSRLEQCGRLHFYMERDLVVYEEHHFGIALPMAIPAFRSNYDLIWLHRFHNITRANTIPMAEPDLWRCTRGTLTGIHCWPLRSGSLDARTRELTQHWIDHQPLYQLDDHCAGS